AGDEAALCKGLEEAGLSQERRALRVRAEGFAWSWPQPDVLELRFRLPPGCYATAVLAGLCGESGEGAGDALPDGD
ncbi:MAG: hypothetical protein ACRC2H_12680, partial [Silanimonas sp.]